MISISRAAKEKLRSQRIIVNEIHSLTHVAGDWLTVPKELRLQAATSAVRLAEKLMEGTDEDFHSRDWGDFGRALRDCRRIVKELSGAADEC